MKPEMMVAIRDYNPATPNDATTKAWDATQERVQLLHYCNFISNLQLRLSYFSFNVVALRQMPQLAGRGRLGTPISTSTPDLLTKR
jgi:hypothetical protein